MEFQDQSENPAEDEQSSEKQPVTVEVLERTDCDEATVQEWLVEWMASNTIHCHRKQQWNDDQPEDNNVQRWQPMIHKFELGSSSDECQYPK